MHVNKYFQDFDYTKPTMIIEEALKELRKNKHLYDHQTYLQLRSEIIEGLELAKNSRYKLTIFDEASYSYKLVF